jgi:hypothetical protein
MQYPPKLHIQENKIASVSFVDDPFAYPLPGTQEMKKKANEIMIKKDIRLQDQISPQIHLPKHIQELPDRCRRLRLLGNNIACVHPLVKSL